MSKENGEFINNIKSVPFKKYSGVSSREKLVVYSIKYLNDHNIPTTFNYVCMTAYKLFPEEFKLSDEFPEQADIAGLNRTLMHLRPSDRNLAYGKPNTFYELNDKGKALANQVQEGIEKGFFETVKKIAKHDIIVEKQNKGEYLKFIGSNSYKLMLNSDDYKLDYIWSIFDVIPFTCLDQILSKIKKIDSISKLENNSKCSEICALIMADIKKIKEATLKGRRE